VRERRIVAVARRGERYLLVRNADTSDLLAGLWEFPWTAVAPVPGGTRDAPAGRAAWETALAQAYGGEWRVGARRGRARHGITFRSLELEVHEAEVRLDGDLVAERATSAEPGWLSLDEIAAVPTTSMVRKVLACLAATER
jgi:adenine-specific DNA glycosylase